MSRFDAKDIAIKELEDIITDISADIEYTAYINSILQDALEHIASDTEEDAQQIAQETLEAIDGSK